MYQFKGIPKTITLERIVFTVESSFDRELRVKDEKFLDLLNDARANNTVLLVTVDYGCIIVALEIWRDKV